MVGNNDYDVTKWPVGNPYEDIGDSDSIIF